MKDILMFQLLCLASLSPSTITVLRIFVLLCTSYIIGCYIVQLFVRTPQFYLLFFHSLLVSFFSNLSSPLAFHIIFSKEALFLFSCRKSALCHSIFFFYFHTFYLSVLTKHLYFFILDYIVFLFFIYHRFIYFYTILNTFLNNLLFFFL